jgi:DNA-binding response OmpR family regulator
MTGVRALVVDDDDPIRALLATVVEHQGFDVDTARDGKEAIDRLDEDGYALVVLDLMMPRIDGYTVLRYIKESRPDLLRCTIIASAVPETEIRKRLPEPVYRIHVKPFDMQKLISDIQSCRAA